MNYLPMNLTLYFITEITLIDIKKLWNKLIIPEQSAFTDQLILLYLYCYPLSSRLYCRLRNRTESCLMARGFTTGRELHPALKILFYFYQQFLRFILLISDSILSTFISVKIFFRKVTLLPSLH